MDWLFRVLDRTARLWPLAAILALILLFRSGMQATLARLREVSGQSIPDYQILYSRDRLVEMFQSYGADGAALYQRFMTFDLVFPLLYSLFFASLLHLVLARSRFRLLALTPFVMALLDYIENGFFFVFLKAQPDIPQLAVLFANGFTLGKFGFGGLTAISGVVAVVVLIRSRRRPTSER